MAERILIVDDDPDALTLIGLTLERRGYSVVKAAGGAEALELVQQERPDLILLDLMMPHMDGYEVCRRLKSDAQYSDIPVVMLTAKAQVTSQVEGYRVGADDYITKPVHPVDLASHIEAVLERARERKLRALAGSVIGVLGVKGGVGTTTISVNLATALAATRNAVLADFDDDGVVAIHLGLQKVPYHHLEALALSKPELMTRDAVSRTLMSHPSGLHVLPAAEEQFTPEHAHAIVTHLDDLADVCVLDLGARLNSLVRALLPKCALVLVAVDADRAALTQAQRMLLALNEMGVTRSRQWIVWVNRAGVDPQHALETIRSSIGGDGIYLIDQATESVYKSVESGLPLVISDADSPAAKALDDMAQAALAQLTSQA